MKDVVFFLHRVYPDREDLRDDIDLKTFEKALILIKSVFKVVPLQALFEESSPHRRAAITFDDGYADNFVYAYPILKKLGLCAHLFISSGRMNKGFIRKTLKDYWDGKISFKELYRPKSMFVAHREFIKNGNSKEFLSWEELNAMSDVFSYGAHGIYHYSYPKSDKIIDFYSRDNYHWTLHLYSSEPFVGQPIFPTRSAIDVFKFIPFKEFLEFCKSFPKKGDWKKELRKEIELNFKKIGKFETLDEARKRIKWELKASREAIKDRLGILPTTFAFPFGHYSSFSKEIASSFYNYLFTIKKGVITPFSDPKELPRVSLGKDIFTVLGRLATFSSDFGFWIYKKFKRSKVL